MTAAVETEPSFADAFRIREFRWLWLADTQSAIGDQLARVAISVLVYRETSSAAWTALTFALSYLPALFGGFFLSGLADRLPRRGVIVTCDVLRAVLVAGMAIPHLPLVFLCLLIVLEVVVSSVFTTAESALVPDILPESVYPVASALRTSSNQICQVGGFAVGGVAIAALGTRTSLLVDAATFFLSAVAIRCFVAGRPSAADSLDPQAERSSIRLGLRTIFSDRILRRNGLLIWLVALYSVGEGIAVPYAHAVGGGSAAAGLLLAAMPAGTAVGTVALAHFFTTRQRTNLVSPLALVAGVPWFLCAFHPGLAVSVGLWFVGGALSAYFVPAITIFTASLPNHVRGQAVGLAAALLLTAQGLAIAGTGALAQWLSPAEAVAISGVLGTIGCVIVGGREALVVAHRRVFARGAARASGPRLGARGRTAGE